ncbi:MAG: hypothetical protein ACE5KG_02895 [Nitrososphaerales archaeon]
MSNDESKIEPNLGGLIDIAHTLKHGLDPAVLASWYNSIEASTKAVLPDELIHKVTITQDPLLPMKFDLKVSRRVVPYFIDAIEKNLGLMPFSTKLYFQKLQQMIEEQLHTSNPLAES